MASLLNSNKSVVMKGSRIAVACDAHQISFATLLARPMYRVQHPLTITLQLPSKDLRTRQAMSTGTV